MKLRAVAARFWSAVTCHRFWCFGDLSPKQGRVQRPGRVGRLATFDGDKSPAQSADKSAHSKGIAALPRWDNSRHSRLASRAAQRGFTMIEIAIALAVIAFALVAIIGVLPIGLNVQRDNRAETIVNQDATYWLEAIRGGAQGLDDLTNYVERITIQWTNPASVGSIVFTNANLPGAMPPTFATGREIIGLLSTPALYGTNVEAIVRTLSGPATEKFTRTDAPGAELVFRYRLTSAVAVVDPTVVQDFNYAVAGGAPEPMSTLFDIQLRFNWPVFGNNTRGTRQKTFRSMASRYLSVATNASTGVGYYYLTP